MPRALAHIPDFSGDLHGARLEVELETYLRPTLTFESVTALIEQIRGDVDEVRSPRRSPAQGAARS